MFIYLLDISVINEALPRDDPHNPCVRSVCLHGDCLPRADSYVCDCHPGFEGPHCVQGISR